MAKKEMLNEGDALAERYLKMRKEPEQYTARDWAGFFAALSSFLEKLAPLIAPFFAEKQE